LERRLDELADEAVTAITTEIPAYAVGTPGLASDVRAHVMAHYRAIVEVLATGVPAAPSRLGFIRAHAGRRVGQVSVGDFVHAFTLAQGLLWRALRDLPRQSQQGQVASADALLQYFEVAITLAAEVYLEYVDVQSAADERTRRDVVSDLLGGRALTAGRLSETAGRHGLSADSPAVVVSAVGAEGVLEPVALRASSRALADALRCEKPPLQVVRHDEIVLLANVAAAPAGLGGRVEQAHRRLANRGRPLTVGVSAVTHTLAGLPAAYDEAVLARTRAAAGSGLLVLADLGAFDFLTLHGDETARRLVDARLASFIQGDLEAGGLLLDTIEAYVASDLNVRKAAGRLHVHVNTAHYRLDRIAERTGLELRRLPDVMELVTAVRLLRP
jgi:sugar diacid utilization regulator